jgi:hypothetical protein
MELEQAGALRKPFPPEVVGKLPRITCKKCSEAYGRVCEQHKKSKCEECGNWITDKHIHLDYIGHAVATDRLLQVDPEWRWTPVALDEHGLPAFDRNGGLWINLTVAGVTRLGYGDAQGKTGPNAVKEAIGDAIRNAGMRFGIALDLWSKEELHPPEQSDRPFRQATNLDATADPWQLPKEKVPVAEVMAGAMQTQRGTATTQPASKKQIGLIGAMMTDRKMRDHDQALAFVNRTINADPPITSRNDLTKAQASKVIEALDLIPIPTEPDWQD